MKVRSRAVRVMLNAIADTFPQAGPRPGNRAAGLALRGRSFEPLEPRRLMSGVNVTTYHYDNARDGANTNETILTQANVNSTDFGKVAQVPVDGQIYTEPLIMTGVAIPGQGTHDIVLVATQHDSVYAFDAYSTSTTPLWKVSLLQTGETPVPESVYGSTDITPELGVTGTPVINPATGIMYVVGLFQQTSGSTVTGYSQRIYALNISNGSNAVAPVTIAANVSGSTYSNSTYNNPGGVVTFSAFRENQRPALTLANGEVYIAWASHGDQNPWHGWVIAYNAATLHQDYAYCDSINGQQGGIWMSGGGIAVDSAGNLYFTTGNGTFDGNSGGVDYGMAVEKLSPTLSVEDYFTPSDEANLSNADLDYGCSSVILLPTQTGTAPDEMVTESKWGTMYLNNSDTGKLGEYNATTDNDLGEGNIYSNTLTSNVHNTMSAWDGHVYIGGDGLQLQMFNVSNGTLTPTEVTETANTFGSMNSEDGQGTGPTVSSNGNANGIVWALDNSSFASSTPAVLYAYNASNLGQMLYSSSQAANSRDAAGAPAKFQDAVVANGHVYVAGGSIANPSGGSFLTIYGLLTSGTNVPTITTAAAASPTTVTGTTTAVSTNATDPSGDAAPVYSWAATTVPSGAPYPTFSVNGTTTSKAATATFYQAGSYTLTVTVTDPTTNLATISSVNVVVTATATRVNLTPAGPTAIADSQTVLFGASVVDQFGIPLTSQPTITYSLVSPNTGSISTGGLYVAPNTGVGTAIVQASDGGLTARSTVEVTTISTATFYPTLAGWWRGGVWQGTSGSDGGTNYTSPAGSTVLISKNPSSGTLRDAYLKYNISNTAFAGDIVTSATLSFNASALNQAGPLAFGVYSMSNTSWGSTTADPSPAPTYTGSTLIGSTQNVGSTQGSYGSYTFNLGTTISNTTSGLVSFELNSPAVTAQETGIEIDAAFNTPGVDPVITITYAAPQPAWLGAGSLAAWNSSSNVLTVTGPTTIIADPGSDQPVVMANGSAAAVTINPAGTLQVHLGGLSLTNGATAVVTSLGSARTASNHRVLVLGLTGATAAPLFNIDSASQLNLTDNDLVDHDGSLTAMNALLKSGLNEGVGYWNGKGVVSANAASSFLTTLGDGQAATAGTFDSESVTTTDVEVRYTYYGDANLDGRTDGSDYTLIDYGFTHQLTGYTNGDFNYDGVIDGSDYSLIDNDYNNQGAAFDAQPLTATAESIAATSTAPASPSVVVAPPAREATTAAPVTPITAPVPAATTSGRSIPPGSLLPSIAAAASSAIKPTGPTAPAGSIAVLPLARFSPTVKSKPADGPNHSPFGELRITAPVTG